MNFRNTIILAVIVAAFGAYLWYVEKPAAEREAAGKMLLEFDREDVVGIELESEKGKIVLARSDGRWTITEPRRLDADQTAVNNLLGAIADAELKRTVEESPESLAPFGLEKPEATVQLTLEGGEELPRVALGKKTPIGFSAYAKRGDEPAVLLTADTVRTGMQKELTDLRDKSVLQFNDADVRAITITGVEPEPTVLRKEGNDWQLAAPVAAKADAAQVRSLLGSLRSLRAAAFVDDAGSPPDAKYQLTPPRVSVELVVGPNEDRQTLLVGGATEDPAKKQIYVQAQPGGTVFEVGSHVFTTVSKQAADFRDKTVLAFAEDTVTSVNVVRADGDGFTLAKKGDAWTVADAGDAAVKEFVASRFVSDLRDLKGTDIASETGPEPGFGLDAPLLTVTVAGAGGDLGTIRISRVGEGKDTRIYASSSGSDTVYVLQDYLFQRIDKRRADFLDLPEPSPTAAQAGDGVSSPGATPASDGGAAAPAAS